MLHTIMSKSTSYPSAPYFTSPTAPTCDHATRSACLLCVLQFWGHRSSLVMQELVARESVGQSAQSTAPCMRSALARAPSSQYPAMRFNSGAVEGVSRCGKLQSAAYQILRTHHGHALDKRDWHRSREAREQQLAATKPSFVQLDQQSSCR